MTHIIVQNIFFVFVLGVERWELLCGCQDFVMLKILSMLQRFLINSSW